MCYLYQHYKGDKGEPMVIPKVCVQFLKNLKSFVMFNKLYRVSGDNFHIINRRNFRTNRLGGLRVEWMKCRFVSSHGEQHVEMGNNAVINKGD